MNNKVYNTGRVFFTIQCTVQCTEYCKGSGVQKFNTIEFSIQCSHMEYPDTCKVITSKSVKKKTIHLYLVVFQWKLRILCSVQYSVYALFSILVSTVKTVVVGSIYKWQEGGCSSEFTSNQLVTWAPRYILFYSRVYSTVYITVYSVLYSLVYSTL